MKSCLLVFWFASAIAAVAAELPMADGSFKPTDESLKQYQCPEWFRDAKFGIWSHWGPQAVPRQGDWYARRLYLGENHLDRKTGQPNPKPDPAYEHHVQAYGHPSKFGYKDIIPLWKAEKWNPEQLMALYKKAGAKYFVSMGTHHDNFFLWNSKLHRWNAVNMGPKKDVVGLWQQAARQQGLRFGVSEHLGASYTWFQASHLSDATGPMQGVPYDGNDPQYQDLYHGKADPGDRGWLTTNAVWQRQWFDRIKELVDSYHPDLLYSDSGMPFGDTGRSLIAHLYNQDMARHGGKVETVYNCKEVSAGKWVRDIERGVAEGISPDPWQTDTSIGDWYYRTGQKYKTAREIVHMLADIVSKNGNLLINIVQTPEGDLEPDMLTTLEQIGAWTAMNGEAIYGTRPWKVYGEGPTKLGKGRHGGLTDTGNYTPSDIRFTTKPGALYAIALGWPAPTKVEGLEDGALVVRSVPISAGRITDVALLGHSGKLDWKQTEEGLVVRVPAQKPCDFAYALKITAGDLTPVPVVHEGRVLPGADGGFVLAAAEAEIHGDTPKYENRGGKDHIGFWSNAADFVSWPIQLSKPGAFKVDVTYSCATHAEGSAYAIEAGGQTLVGKSTSTGSWVNYRTDTLGQLTLGQPGLVTVSVKPRNDPKWKVISLKSVTLTPLKTSKP